MKKVLVLISMTLLLSGCGRFERWWAGTTGNAIETCEGGVAYYQFTSGATVAYNPNGTIKTCSYR
jgi:hypothetical protein